MAPFLSVCPGWGTPSAASDGDPGPCRVLRCTRFPSVWLQHWGHQRPTEGGGPAAVWGRVLRGGGKRKASRLTPMFFPQVIEQSYNATWLGRQGPGGPTSIPQGTLTTLWALSVAIFSVGGMISSFLVGIISQWLGRYGAGEQGWGGGRGGHSTGALTGPPLGVPARKRAMLANNVLAVLGGTLMGLANVAASYELLILGRFLIGAYSGTRGCYGSSLCPAVLSHVWAAMRESATFGPFFFLLPRADIRVGAYVCGRNRPHSSSGCSGDAQPIGHRHWHSDCPGT